MALIQYSSRDETSILAQLNADPDLVQKPYWIKKIFASAFGVLSNAFNAVVTALFPRTFYARDVATDVLALIDYIPKWKLPAQVTMTVNVQSSATSGGPYTIPAANLAFTTAGTASNPPQRFESRADVTFAQNTTQTSVYPYQQTTQVQRGIGLTTAASFQRVDLPYLDVLTDTIALTIGSDTYRTVATLARSGVNDLVCRHYYKSDGSSYVVLPGTTADGVQLGKISAAGLIIYLNCAIGGGSAGNVAASAVTQYVGGDANVTTVTNPAAALNGTDPEPLNVAAQSAFLSLRAAAGTFVSMDQGRGLARQVAGVLDCQIVRTGVLTCSAYVIPTSGGTPSAGVLTAVAAQLSTLSVWGEATVSAHGATYVGIAIVYQFSVLPGFVWSAVKPYADLAAVYRIASDGAYVQSVFQSFGLAAAITEINNRYSSLTGYTYSSSSALDSAAVSAILSAVRVSSFGESISLADISTPIEAYVAGIDDVIVTTPASRVIIGTGQISSASSVTSSVLT